MRVINGCPDMISADLESANRTFRCLDLAFEDSVGGFDATVLQNLEVLVRCN